MYDHCTILLVVTVTIMAHCLYTQMTCRIADMQRIKKVKQFRYRPGVAWRVPGS
jgi:hypothetical protein